MSATRPTDLCQRDLGLGLETDLVRNSYLAPTVAIVRPFLWQVQPIGHRQARIVIGDRQRHRDLTIVLLAKLATILSSHPDRMLPFLGKARVVDDPRFDRSVTFQLWQHQFPHLRENLSSDHLPSPIKCSSD